MRLVQFQVTNSEIRLGVVAGERVLELATAAANAGAADTHFSDMSCFLRGGEEALALARSLTENAECQSGACPLAGVRLRAPVLRPGKIVAIGLNYRDHCLEQGIEPPSAPLIFAKFPTSIAGPYDPIVLPGEDAQVDYEAELGVVIGQNAKRVSACDAMDYVAGYLVLNDVSARRWQFSDRQWVRGKSCDTFCPIGPWLTTHDEVPDPHALHITTRVNGQTLQDSSTANLIFRIPELLQYITASITLEPGDIIATGTPVGVGYFRKPPIFLEAGDVVEVEIERLGMLRNPVVEFSGR
jgi:2-keto-4-pentenoate hydratase/2-oxohepta-3-ene-1,7-dioic acid hydratase in catechol pathway